MRVLNRRTFLAAAVTVTLAAAGKVALDLTGRFDDVARVLGIEPTREPAPGDSALLARVASDEVALHADLSATADAHAQLDRLGAVVEIAERHLRALEAAPAGTGSVLSRSELDERLAAAVTARRADAVEAVSGEFAALLASLAAAHAQQRVVVRREDFR